MSKTVTYKCDGCGKSITAENPIIAKLYFSPVLKTRARTDHGSYSRHADIGLCCSAKIVKGIDWRMRQTREDYHNGRRLRSKNAVGARSGRAAGKKK